MLHKRLIPDRRLLRSSEVFQSLKVPQLSQSIELEIPEPISKIDVSQINCQDASFSPPILAEVRERRNREGMQGKAGSTDRLSGTLKSARTFSARFAIPFRRHVLIVSLTLCPKKLICPSASFSSCCCKASSRTFSSIILIGDSVSDLGSGTVREEVSHVPLLQMPDLYPLRRTSGPL